MPGFVKTITIQRIRSGTHVVSMIPSYEVRFSSNGPTSCESARCESMTCVVKINLDRGSRGFYERVIDVIPGQDVPVNGSCYILNRLYWICPSHDCHPVWVRDSGRDARFARSDQRPAFSSTAMPPALRTSIVVRLRPASVCVWRNHSAKRKPLHPVAFLVSSRRKTKLGPHRTQDTGHGTQDTRPGTLDARSGIPPRTAQRKTRPCKQS